MWVSPEFRGSGLAVDLVDALFEWAAGNRFECLRAGVTAQNKDVLRFYQRYGFVMIGPSALDSDDSIQLRKSVHATRSEQS